MFWLICLLFFITINALSSGTLVQYIPSVIQWIFSSNSLNKMHIDNYCIHNLPVIQLYIVHSYIKEISENIVKLLSFLHLLILLQAQVPRSPWLIKVLLSSGLIFYSSPYTGLRAVPAESPPVYPGRATISLMWWMWCKLTDYEACGTFQLDGMGVELWWG